MANRQFEQVAIVGFGYIGCTIGAVLASRGYNVIGIDKSQRILDTIDKGDSPFAEPGLRDLIRAGKAAGRLSVTNNLETVRDCDVVLIAVGTPLSEDGTADLSDIKSTSKSIAPYLRDGQLVIFKSTLPPGATSEVATPILRSYVNVSVAFSPERLAEGRAIEELLSIPIIVGGVDDQSTKRAVGFWREALKVKVLPVRSSGAAELVKLADNLWIDLNIALANELAMLADKLPEKIDVLEVISAANTLPKGEHNVNILCPSMGVGGYCLTKDPWFVAGMGTKLGLDLKTPETSRTVNDKMPSYFADRLETYFESKGVSIEDLKVAILGLSFKTNTGDCRFTPVKPFLDALRARKVSKIFVYDPWVLEEEATALGENLCKDMESALDGADCVAFCTGHDEFKRLTASYLNQRMSPNGLVLDGRIFFPQAFIDELKSLGLAYRGVGR